MYAVHIGRKLADAYLGLFGTPSGVWERDDAGLDSGGLGAEGFFHCEGKSGDKA